MSRILPSIDGSNSGQKKSRKITLELLLNSTSLTRSSKETHEGYLTRVTHLHLQGKRIKVIENLETCTNLKVLYLYDNMVEIIQNLEFAKNLQYLYLHNNAIKEIPLLNMPHLHKLSLNENEIRLITNLQGCPILEELNVSNQRLPSFTSLEFDFASIATFQSTLTVLDISGNNISKLQPFSMFYNLKKFFCTDNAVVDLTEIEEIVSLRNLEEVDFSRNPCCSLVKYRDIVIAAGSNVLTILDGIEIPKHQQIAIKGLMAHRRRLGTTSTFQPLQSDANSYVPQPVDIGNDSYNDN